MTSRSEVDLRATLEADLADAERKAWDSLARWKFWMFGYHAADVVKIKRRLGRGREPFFKELVELAREVMARRYGVAIGVTDDDYLVWSILRNAWWRAGGAGYTADLKQAGRFTREQAIATCAGCRDGYSTRIVPSEIPLRLADVMCSQVGTLPRKLVRAEDDAECHARDRAMQRAAA